MSDRLLPETDAKKRIQALSQSTLQAFFDEVPAAAMQRIARYLPSIDGFRKTSQAGIIKQKEALARRLGRPGVTDRDYHGLYFIWRTWIDENLTNAEFIQEQIDEVEEAAIGKPNANERQDALKHQVNALLEKLKEESKQNRCTREQIERLFTFSPFPETSASAGIIAAAKSAAEVERDATLYELPTRLRQDESEIQAIKSGLTELSNRVDALALSQQNFPSEAEKVKAAISEAKEAGLSAKQLIEPYLEAVGEKGSKGTSETERQLLGNVEAELEKLRSDVQGISSKLPDLEQVRAKAEELGIANDLLAEEHGKLSNRIEGIVAELESLKRERESETDIHTTAVDIAGVSKRVEALEKQLGNRPSSAEFTAGAKPASVPGPANFSADDRGLSWQRLCPADQSVDTIQSSDELVNGFVSLLQSFSLRKSAAQNFGEELAAAFACKQVIFLQGACATQLARALARRVAGPFSARLSIPLSLQDGERLRHSINEAATSGSQFVGAISLEGINRTALDIVREVILDCSDVESKLMRSTRVAIFATITRGVASLPIDAGYLDLGPVFDLDYLDWRVQSTSEAGLAAGTLAAELDQRILSECEKAEADNEEVLKLARSFTKKRNPTFDRSLVLAYKGLHRFRTDRKSLTPLQSLYFGWLLPYWRVLSLSKDQVDSELDGGKADGTTADPRLAAMLDAEFPDGDRSGGAA